MLAALAELAADPAVRSLRAVFRSPRDWHCLAPTDNAKSADLPPTLLPTASRRESRIECRLLPDRMPDLAAWEQRWRVIATDGTPFIGQ